MAGCLTVRRARAQQKAACKTAAGFKNAFLRTANKKAYDLILLRRQYRCAVISGASQVHQTLDQAHGPLIRGLENGRRQARRGLGLARTQNLAAVDSALRATLQTLSAQEFSQRQSVNDIGYLKQLAIDQLAHGAAANLARGVSAAMDALEQTLGALTARIAAGGSVDPVALERALAHTRAALGGGMGLLLGKMEEGTASAEASIAEAGYAGLAALIAITTANNDQTSQGESAWAAQVSGLRRGASRTFNQLTNTHVQQCRRSTTEGVTSMRRAVTGFDEALATIGTRIDQAVATSLQQLNQQLQEKMNELDGQIAREAWKAASKEQPAWKKVLAVVLIILVIIAATLISIATLGAGAGFFAMVLVGALVGAISAGLIQILTNWSSGEAWHEGLVRAMVMGAVGGAIGGALGYAGGALVQGAAAAGARAVTQFGIQLGADIISEGLTQTFGYVAYGQAFNWQGFVMAGAMSGISFRVHPAAPHGVTPHVPPPRPSMGRNVATGAAGAGVGLVVEGASALISGQELDPTRLASAGASAASTARASRRSGGGAAPRTGTPHVDTPDAPRPRPAAPDQPSFAANVDARLRRAGARLVGGDPDLAAPAPRRVGEPAAGDVEQPAAPRPNQPDDGAPRPHEGPPQSESDLPRRPSDSEPLEADPQRPANQRSDAELADPPVRTMVGDEPHDVTVRRTRDGRAELWVCSAECGQMLGKVDALRARPGISPEVDGELRGLRDRIVALQGDIDSGRVPSGNVRRLKDQLAMDLYNIGRRVPGFGAALNLRSVAASGTAAVDLHNYLPEGVVPSGPQRTIELGPGWQRQVEDLRLQGREVIYVVRDADTGRILKVGKSEDLLGRLGPYSRASQGDLYGGRVHVDVMPVDVRASGRGSIVQIEAGARARVEAELQGQPGVTSREVPLVGGGTRTVWYAPDGRPIMEWDNTLNQGVGRLGRTGPGTPGVVTHDMAHNTRTTPQGAEVPDPLYWRRNAQGVPEIVSTTGAGPRPPRKPLEVENRLTPPSHAELASWWGQFTAEAPGSTLLSRYERIAAVYQETYGKPVSTSQVRNWLEKAQTPGWPR